MTGAGFSPIMVSVITLPIASSFTLEDIEKSGPDADRFFLCPLIFGIAFFQYLPDCFLGIPVDVIQTAPV